MLFLGCTPLIICDMTYATRFWTTFELWSSMLIAEASGVAVRPAERDMVMRFINNAVEQTFKPVLLNFFDGKNHKEVYTMLARNDITVTRSSPPNRHFTI